MGQGLTGSRRLIRSGAGVREVAELRCGFCVLVSSHVCNRAVADTFFHALRGGMILNRVGSRLSICAGGQYFRIGHASSRNTVQSCRQHCLCGEECHCTNLTVIDTVLCVLHAVRAVGIHRP